MDILSANRAAWDLAAVRDNPYARAVSPSEVADARQGSWSIYLSDRRSVPASWFPDLAGRSVLCLASGGGQQGPILAAAGASVWVLDASAGQLEQDRLVADRDGLELTTVMGDMADLSVFDDGAFDLIVNPPSTLFVPDLLPVFRECHRVLRPGGHLLMSFMNPDDFVFDADALDEGRIEVRFSLPYVEVDTLSDEEREQGLRDGRFFHFSHTMEAQLGQLTEVGFAVTGFYEDRRPDWDGNPLRHYLPSYYVVRAERWPPTVASVPSGGTGE